MTHLSHSSIIFISYKNDGTYYHKNIVRKYTLNYLCLDTFEYFFIFLLHTRQGYTSQVLKTFEKRCSKMKQYSKVDETTLQYDFKLHINAGAASQACKFLVVFLYVCLYGYLYFCLYICLYLCLLVCLYMGLSPV